MSDSRRSRGLVTEEHERKAAKVVESRRSHTCLRDSISSSGRRCSRRSRIGGDALHDEMEHAFGGGCTELREDYTLEGEIASTAAMTRTSSPTAAHPFNSLLDGMLTIQTSVGGEIAMSDLMAPSSRGAFMVHCAASGRALPSQSPRVGIVSLRCTSQTKHPSTP